jgi:hypothetical protein
MTQYHQGLYYYLADYRRATMSACDISFCKFLIAVSFAGDEAMVLVAATLDEAASPQTSGSPAP